jgi:hypothetical protein
LNSGIKISCSSASTVIERNKINNTYTQMDSASLTHHNVNLLQS